MFNPRELGIFAQCERIGSAARHRLDEPPGYPSARLHPYIARIRFVRQVARGSAFASPLRSFLSQLISRAECAAWKVISVHPAHER
jgi:hypothetical protein